VVRVAGRTLDLNGFSVEQRDDAMIEHHAALGAETVNLAACF
jgi:hypothetical protein